MELTTKTMRLKDNITARRLNIGKKKHKWPLFERFYIFVMLIYAAQMTPETARMIQNISGNPVPFLIPIVLTAILLFKHRINFLDKRLLMVISVTGLWSIASILKYEVNSLEELSYHFFIYYAIIIAYIHIKVFGTDLMSLYEELLVLICKITLPLWLFCVLAPSIATPFFNLFPETIFGHNFLYIFNKINADVYDEGYLFLRNAGFSWEPGRFAVMICFAILFNIQRKGVTFVKNNNIYWLLISLLSTESTTGYSTVIVLYALNLLSRKWTIRNVLLALFIFVPIVLQTTQLDFMTGKIVTQYEKVATIDKDLSGKYSDHTRTIALDRMPSLVIEFGNFLEDPLLGYSRNIEHAAIFKTLPDNITFTGGLMQMFSQFGIFLALFYYGILFYSSRKVGKYFGTSKLGLAMCTILSLLSYPLFMIPLFFAFWLQGIFLPRETKKIKKI